MLLNQTTYFIKERVAFAKLTDTYDILNPQTQETMGIAKEEPSVWAKWLRLVVNKQLLPTTLTSTNAKISRRSFPFIGPRRSSDQKSRSPMETGSRLVISKANCFRWVVVFLFSTRATSKWLKSKATGKAGTSSSSVRADVRSAR